MGVIAYQLPTDQFNALLSDGRGLGVERADYIVGKDHFLRERPARYRRRDPFGAPRWRPRR